MQITLMCHDKYGSVAFRAETIEGLTVMPRRYTIDNYRVTLAGYPDEVLHHDAQELLSNPFFRMSTPAEQDAMAEAERAASAVQENAPVAPEEKTEPAVQENEPEVSPTPTTPKKSSKVNGR